MITWNWSDTDCKNEWAIFTRFISLTGPFWCSHGLSNHLINGTDNRPFLFIWQSKSFYNKDIIHLHCVASGMKVSSYVDSDH